jgi:hypothetical protein
MKTANVLPSCVWRKRYIHPVVREWQTYHYGFKLQVNYFSNYFILYCQYPGLDLSLWLMDTVTYLLILLLSLQKTNPFVVWNTCEVTRLRFNCLTAICKIEVLLKRRSCWDIKDFLKSVTQMVNIISKRYFYQYFSSGSICGLNTCLIQGTICRRIHSLIVRTLFLFAVHS